MTTGLLVLSILGARIHWMLGLFGGIAYAAAALRPARPVGLPASWWTLPAVLAALAAASVLSPHPLDLPWVGLLQWISLGVLILLFRDVFRRDGPAQALVLWSLLGIAAIDTVHWSAVVVGEHLEWWRIRSGDLPLFPFRIRLFGSHGSTQAAAWMGFAILLGRTWAIPRIRWAPARIATWAWLVLQALAMAHCDSRLGWAGLAVGALLAGRGSRPDFPLTHLLLLQGVVWLARDHFHPSSIVSGGGSRSGIAILSMSVALVAVCGVVKAFPRRLPRSALAWGWSVVAMLAHAAPFLLTFLPDNSWGAWTTGRARFWEGALEIFAERPLLGGGPWSFSWFYSQTGEWTQAFLPMHPHNWLLEILTSGGLATLAFVLWLAPRIVRSAWTQGAEAEIPWVALLGFWCTSMLFDSPLSSPQILLVTAIVWGGSWSTLADGILVRLPRVLWLLPALLLLPLSQAALLVSEGARLSSLGDAGLEGDWETATRGVILGKDDALPGPQADRILLQARTIVAASHPSRLKALLPAWEKQVGMEPGNLGNLLHRDWVAWRVHGGPTEHERFRRSCDSLRRSWEPMAPPPTARPGVEYGSDDLLWWVARYREARREGDMGRARWCARWIRQVAPSGTIQGFCTERALGWSPTLPRTGVGKESAIYSISGTGWFLVPPVLGDVAKKICVF